MSQPTDQELLNQLKQQPPANLARGVQEVERLTPEEHDVRKRAAKFFGQKHWAERVSPCLNWLYCGVIVFVVGIACFLMGSYIWAIRNDLVQIKLLLSKGFELGLVAAATLFLEKKVSGKE